ncbi:hypothetical protein FKW77_004039 [Venturia effusa]|uniref:Glutathione peroxidase n=1 Tax=Venturia effusa TaxID=50376 RepID=A0A517LJZ3_9PEZI|nr:hypothetical protein FKW77_004039 [Venturia effusa]
MPLNVKRRAIIEKAARNFSTATSSSFTRQPHPLRTFNTTYTPRYILPVYPAIRRGFATTTTMASATTFFDFKPVDKKGSAYSLEQLKGKVVLVVNTASKCGFTPQFDGLEKLYKEVKAEHPNDFEIIGFPCNQFGGQDPGSNDEIQEFCKVNYGVSFPVLGKIDVNGDKADPVYEWMKNEKPGLLGLQRIKWNFEKFLIGRDGKVINRWASTTRPESLKKEIEAALAKAPAAKV